MDKINTIIDQLETVKAKDIKVFNLTGQSPYYDYFIIATTTDRQSSAAVSYIKKAIDAKEIKQVEGFGTSWLLVDCYDIIIHLFHEEDRQFYNLDERLIEFLHEAK